MPRRTDSLRLIAAACALCVPAGVSGQRAAVDGLARIPARRIVRLRQRPAPLRAPGAFEVLRRKLRPTMDFSGEQVTEVAGGSVSRQHVYGDTRGRVRVDYEAPAGLAGDVLVFGPAQYRNYHRATDTLDVALWPSEWNAREKRVLAQVQAGRMSVRQTGTELIAGRMADIIELATTSRRGGRADGIVRYWIDQASGIQLKNEIWNARGFVSRSYFTSIVVGPAAGVLPATFNPRFPPSVRVNPLFPGGRPEYATIQEAAAALPFVPVQPAALPAGFRLSGIWVFGSQPAHKGALLLRYSDGVTNFSLFERPAPPTARPRPRGRFADRARIQQWIAGPGNGVAVLYIGFLAPEQAAALRDSLR